jgi:hypothetical protein
MANPKIYCTDLTNQVFTSSVGDDASYPASNLNDYFTTPYWKSANNNASQYLWVDMANTTRTRTAIVIENHNLQGIMATGGMKIQAADNSGFSSGLIDVDAAFSPNADPYVKEFSSGSNKRYWRILFNGTLNSIPYIGNVFLDLFLDFGFSYDSPFKANNPKQEAVTERAALDGTIRTSRAYASRKFFEFKFSLLNNTFKTNFLDFINTVDNNFRPFYFVDKDGSVYYVKCDNPYNPVESLKAGLNNVSLILKKQKVG